MFRDYLYMNLPVWNRLSLRIVLFVVIIFSSAILVYIILFIQSQTNVQKLQIIANGRTFAELSAPLLYQDYLTASAKGFPSFEDLVKARLQKNTDISRVMLIAFNGKIIFDSQDIQSGQQIGRTGSTNDKFVDDKIILNALQEQQLTTREITENKEKLQEIIVPISEAGGGHLFSMRYIVSFHSLQSLIRDVYRQALMTFFPFFLFTTGAGIFLAFSITGPIRSLIAGVEQLKQKNFQVRVPINTRDEIGLLAQAFNQAAATIEENQGIIQKHNKNLEKEVSERTNDLQQKIQELEQMNKLMVGREIKMTELKEEIERLKKQ